MPAWVWTKTPASVPTLPVDAMVPKLVMVVMRPPWTPHRPPGRSAPVALLAPFATVPPLSRSMATPSAPVARIVPKLVTVLAYWLPGVSDLKVSAVVALDQRRTGAAAAIDDVPPCRQVYAEAFSQGRGGIYGAQVGNCREGAVALDAVTRPR